VGPLAAGLALVLLAQAGAPAGAPGRPEAPPGLSWDEADALARTVARVSRRLRSGRPASAEPIVVTERALNSYLNLTLAPKMPPALSGLAVGLERDRLVARGELDLDRVKSKAPPGVGAGVLAFLSGTVPVELRGRLASGGGVGRLDVEEAVVAGVSLPPAMVAQIVAQSTRSEKRPQGFDLTTPFPLPYGARSIRLEPGRAVVDFSR
jgi:hypothetical protein